MSRGQDGAHPAPAGPFLHSLGAWSMWPLHRVPAECGWWQTAPTDLPAPHGPAHHVALLITHHGNLCLPVIPTTKLSAIRHGHSQSLARA